MKSKPHRRAFLKNSGAAAAVTATGLNRLFSTQSTEPAILGGTPLHRARWHEWPVWDRAAESRIISILRSGNWWRGAGETIEEFERAYAELIGARRCLATASGTTALLTSLNALDVDAGDEVLVAPYTFIATYNVVFQVKALPVFVDTDIETFTMNPAKIEERITERTRAILPVHIYGLPAEMDAINEIARKHDLVVLEDACQAWLASYQDRLCGTLGDLGCFSFQNSKNLPAGEGGAVTGNNDELMDRCFSFHDHGRSYGSIKGYYSINGTNFRMQHFQAAILLSQMKRIQADAEKRDRNARHLTKRLEEIPGIMTLKMTRGATRSAYHVYPFRYDSREFSDLPKEKFIRAMRAEGIPCGGGYGPQNQAGLIKEQLSSRGFQRLFSRSRLERYREKNQLPDNDRLCSQAVTLSQRMLLGTTRDMDDIADAILKIRENLDRLHQI